MSTLTQTPLEDEAFSAMWPEEGAGDPPVRRRRLGVTRELPVLIVLALTMALLIKTFLIQAFYIPSASMVPTLLEKDRVLVNKLAYRFREPKRGEVVVFITGALGADRRSLPSKIFTNIAESLGLSSPRDIDFIKRIVALPGETVQIKEHPSGGRLAVHITGRDGKTFTLDEPYIASVSDLGEFPAFKVPEGSYFLMGDNRANSSDSRVSNFQGVCPTSPCAVPKSRLVGKAFVRIWPPKRIHVFQIPAYGLMGIGFVGLRRRRRARPAA